MSTGRKYEFVPVKNEVVSTSYSDCYNDYLRDFQKSIKELSDTAAYSIKPVQTTGSVFFAGYFYDTSNTRRPDGMPDGPSWRAIKYPFTSLDQMHTHIDTVKRGLSDPDIFYDQAGDELTDEQLYHSIVEVDLWGSTGNVTVWFKTR